MCEIGYHVCDTCQEEYRCKQPNSECAAFNEYPSTCDKCEFWAEEFYREQNKEERLKWERNEWEKQFGFK